MHQKRNRPLQVRFYSLQAICNIHRRPTEPTYAPAGSAANGCHHLNCRCDHYVVKAMPTAVAATSSPPGKAAGTAATLFFAHSAGCVATFTVGNHLGPGRRWSQRLSAPAPAVCAPCHQLRAPSYRPTHPDRWCSAVGGRELRQIPQGLVRRHRADNASSNVRVAKLADNVAYASRHAVYPV